MTVPAKAVDRVAVALCIELGIDPTEVIDICGKMQVLTPAEQALQRLKGRDANPSISGVARWQLYRAKAAELLAMRAVMAGLDRLLAEKPDVPQQSDPGDETDHAPNEIA